jgi:hypothetical protein
LEVSLRGGLAGARLCDLDGADEGAAPAGAGVEGGAHAVESGALDLERLAGGRFDGDLEGGGDSEVD